MTDPAIHKTEKEERIAQGLKEAFGQASENIRVARPRRIFMKLDIKDIERAISYAIEKEAFTILCTITGLDDGLTIGFVYHLARKDGIVLSIQIDVPKTNPKVNTITRFFPCAEIYEREIIDLLGAKVEGLGDGQRYPLPDNWPQNEYPLRKDWKPDIKKPEENNNATA